MVNIILNNIKVEDLNLREEDKVKVVNIDMNDLWAMRRDMEIKPNQKTTSVTTPDYNKTPLTRLNRNS